MDLDAQLDRCAQGQTSLPVGNDLDISSLDARRRITSFVSASESKHVEKMREGAYKNTASWEPDRVEAPREEMSAR